LSVNHDQNLVYAGYSNGSLKIWDTRTEKIGKIVNPFQNKDKWNAVSCIALDDSKNWMVCGGTPAYMTLWYLPSMNVTSVMPTSSSTNDIAFVDDKV
jgi:WD40 repeat protein